MANEKDAIQSQQSALKRELDEARARRAFWAETLAHDEMSKIIRGMEDGIETMKEKLTDATLKTDQTVTLRAEISAYRDLLARIKGKDSSTEVDAAVRKLRKFEEDNAMFVSPLPLTESFASEQEISEAIQEAMPSARAELIDKAAAKVRAVARKTG